MAYGMTIENDSDELVFSDSGYVYSFIGRAVLVGITQPGASATDAAAGHSTYTIDWPADITVALAVKRNGSTKVLNVTRAGNTWTITVFKSNGATNALGLHLQEATEVYVFGAAAPATEDRWGIFLFGGAEKLTADLSRRPMTFRGRVNVDAFTNWAMPAGSYVPAMVGGPPGSSRTATNEGGFYRIRESEVGWRLTSDGTAMYQDLYLTRYYRDDAPGDTYTRRAQSLALLIDVTGL
jgi:hypothetical protein